MSKRKTSENEATSEVELTDTPVEQPETTATEDGEVQQLRDLAARAAGLLRQARSQPDSAGIVIGSSACDSLVRELEAAGR